MIQILFGMIFYGNIKSKILMKLSHQENAKTHNGGEIWSQLDFVWEKSTIGLISQSIVRLAIVKIFVFRIKIG